MTRKSHRIPLRKLIARHRELEALIAAEMRRPWPDLFALQRLKRLKLVVKDQIAAGRRLAGEPLHA